MADISIEIEPIPANPGYVATVVGNDPEIDPYGSGATRFDAALDLARSLIDWSDSHPALCLAIAAVLQADLDAAVLSNTPSGVAYRLAYERAIATVEGIA
jgi:hypothetical protein